MNYMCGVLGKKGILYFRNNDDAPRAQGELVTPPP
jgi:hypothetical protein